MKENEIRQLIKQARGCTTAEAHAYIEANEVTFEAFPITPEAAPDADYEVANKKYVDDNTCQVYTLSWTGNAANNRQLTGFGFDPVAGFVMFDEGGFITFGKFADTYGGGNYDAIRVRSAGYNDQETLKFITDGIEVNNNDANDEFNRNAETYWGVFWG